MTSPIRRRGANVLTGALVGALVAGILFWGVDEARRSPLLGEGLPAPAFELPRYAGGTVSLGGLRGRVVLLDFWATWCPPCMAEMPALLKVAKEFEAQGLVFVAANRDEADEAAREVTAYVRGQLPELAPYVAYANDAVAATYRVEALPTLYLIDREGNVIEAHRGQASESALRSWVRSALARP